MIKNLGTAVRITASFTNFDEDAADPTTITIKISPPNRAEETYVYGTDPEIIREDVGVYHFDLPLDKRGHWYYRWIGTGAVEKVFENTEDPIIVRRSRFDNPI